MPTVAQRTVPQKARTRHKSFPFDSGYAYTHSQGCRSLTGVRFTATIFFLAVLNMIRLRSIRHKLMSMVLLGTLVALFISLAAILAYDVHSAQRKLFADYLAIALGVTVLALLMAWLLLAEVEQRAQALERSNRELAREAQQRAQAQQEVMRLNQELEARVHERTLQLELKNGELALAMHEARSASQAKSAFVSSMSHELRTPLNAILGFAQILSSDRLPSTLEQKKEFAGHILKAGRHLLTLINEILDLAKVESGTLSLSLEPVALRPLLEECRHMTAPLAAGRGIAMVFADDCRLSVQADRTRLKQILLNLLSNAIKYNRDQGSVSIDCAVQVGGRVRISVRDTGMGLDSAQQALLFQPFNRLGQEGGAQEGSGIGLVVTKRLVELMDGGIGVASMPGAGSTFWIALRAADAMPTASMNLTKPLDVDEFNHAVNGALEHVARQPTPGAAA